MFDAGRRTRFGAVLGGAAWGWLFAAALPAWAADDPTPAQMGQAIADRRHRVAEFQVTKEAAEELGIRVWLFGGTAAGFAHYVRWDLAREGGDERYRQSFFDYDFTNIYRSTQDADLVVDGTPEQAERLENLVRERMGFLQGSKEHWEVRLLREDRVAPGGQVKQALLNNHDFLGQHTDSNSTGMIELTDPPPGEAVVRDLRDWAAAEPLFLQDVTFGRLHYYRSPSHEATTRFREGHNPPIFSVIRYLVKAFQYGLTVDGEDLQQVKVIVDAFDPTHAPARMSEWAQGWLERYGPNLIRHAVDVEYAWNTLQALGVREKLIALSEPGEERSLGWWLSREPLRTGEVGTGDGPTAEELGIEVVAHETDQFVHYESLTRDVTLRPNVLISRQGHLGEAAMLGDGFYTQEGRRGARGTGLTVRFRMNPRAREGTDFIRSGGTVLVKNRAALTVIPESLDLSYPDYLELLRNADFTDADRGIWMKLQRRLAIRPLSADDERRAALVVSDAAQGRGPPLTGPLLSEWLAHPAAARHPEVLERVVEAVEETLRTHPAARGGLSPLLKVWFEHPVSERYPRFKETLTRIIAERVRGLALKERDYQGGGWDEEHWAVADPVREWFSLRISTEHPELTRPLIEAGGQGFLFGGLLKRPEWADHPEVIRALRPSPESGDLASLLRILARPEWGRHPELFHSYFDQADDQVDMLVARILSENGPTWWDGPQILRALLSRVSWHSFAPQNLPAGSSALHYVNGWARRKETTFLGLVGALGQARWSDHPELVQALLRALPPSFPPATGEAIQRLLLVPQWTGHPELVLAWVERAGSYSGDQQINLLLREEPWRRDPELRRLCGGAEVDVWCLRASLAASPPAGEKERAAEIVRSLEHPQAMETECR